MANENLDVKITLKDDLSKGVGKIKTNFVDLAAKVFVAQQAFNAVVGVVRTFTDAASRQEDAINKLNTQLKINGSFTEETSRSLQEFAAQMQQVTRFGDEQIIQQTAFAMAMGATADQAKRIIQVAADMSASLNIDLNAAVRNTAKTLGGFAGELGEVIPELKDLTTEQLRAGEGIDILSKKFGGAAKDDVNTFSGSIQQLQNSFGDLLERIGMLITGSSDSIETIKILTSLIVKLDDVIGDSTAFNSRLDNTQKWIQALGGPVSGTLINYIIELKEAEKKNKDFFQSMGDGVLSLEEMDEQLNKVLGTLKQSNEQGGINLSGGEEGKSLEDRIAEITQEKEIIAALDDEELARKIERFEMERIAKIDSEMLTTQLMEEEYKKRIDADSKMRQELEFTAKRIESAMASSLSGMLQGTVSVKDGFKQMGKSAVDAIADFVAEQAVAHTAGVLLQKLAVKLSATSGALVASAWAPAAAMVSLASFGSNSAPAAAGIASVSALTQALATPFKAARFGTDEVVTGPKMFMAGESGRPERVTVEPLGSRSGSSGGNTINIYMDSPSFNSENDANSIGEILGFKIENALRLAR